MSSGSSPKVQAVWRAGAGASTDAGSIGARLAAGRDSASATGRGDCSGGAGATAAGTRKAANAWNELRACAPSAAFSSARLRVSPSWRPCSSTTRRFISRWGASSSSLKSARFSGSPVRVAACWASTSIRLPSPKGAAAMKLSAYSGKGTRRERGRCGSVFTMAATFSFSMPGTSHSQRSSLAGLSA